MGGERVDSDDNFQLPPLSSEQAAILEQWDYDKVYQLTGASLRTLRDAGRTFDHPAYMSSILENVTSMRAYVAVNPRYFLLPGTNNLSVQSQLKEVKRFGRIVETRLPGARVVLGNVADHLELIFAHFDETGEKLAPQEHRTSLIRTSTTFSRGRSAYLGKLRDDAGPSIKIWDRTRTSPHIFIAPLIVLGALPKTRSEG